MVKVPKGAKLPVVRGKVERYIPIADIIEDEANAEIYNFDHLDEIANSITKDGLENCPIVWKGSTYIASGHTRYRAFKKKGYTHLPVTETADERPKSEYERIKYLHLHNMARDVGFGDRVRGIKRAKDAHLTETGKMVSDEDLSDLCSKWRINRGDWNKMEELRQSATDLHAKVLAGEMGIRDAHKLFTLKPPAMRMNKDLSNLLSKQDVKYLITSIQQTVMGVKTLESGIILPGLTFNPMSKVEQNFYSNVIHATACSWMVHRLNSFTTYADDWDQTDNQDAVHDVYSAEDDTGIEVKTHQCDMGETPRWTPKRFKPGYHLLIATAPPNEKGEIESAFIGFGKLDKTHVKNINQGKVEILPDKLWELFKSNEFDVWFGKMSKDRKGKISFKQSLIQ